MMFWLPIYHPAKYPHVWGYREKKEEIRYEYEFINGFYRSKEIGTDDGGDGK